MNALAELTDALEESFQAIETICDELNEDEWAAQSLCPEWTVRGVVTHLATTEHILSAWRPEPDALSPPFDKAKSFVESMRALGTAEFLEEVKKVFAQRRSDLSQLVEADLELPSWTPVGPGVYGRLMRVRIFDFWVHERDITTPLGRSTNDSGPRADIALSEIEGSLGYILGKKVGLPEGKSVAIHLSAPLPRDYFVVVEGKAKVVDHLEHPDVEVTAEPLTFVQLACGRIDPEKAIERNRITWTGDATLGGQVARNLRYTM